MKSVDGFKASTEFRNPIFDRPQPRIPGSPRVPEEPYYDPFDAHNREAEGRWNELAAARATLARVHAIARQSAAGLWNPQEALARVLETLDTRPVATVPARGNLTIHPARPVHAPAFVALMTLALPDADPDDLLALRKAIESGLPPLSESGAVALIALVALDDTGRTVGALIAGTSSWVLTDPEIASGLRPALTRRVVSIDGLAVRPEYRRTGVGRALVRQAENAFRADGWGAVTINHRPDLDAFYGGLGYANYGSLVVGLPNGRVVRLSPSEGRVAVKPLDRSVEPVPVVGLSSPVITGLLPGTSLPAHAWFGHRSGRIMAR
ncbi:GNAT family N-acetyltransferase (plasmid) [Embleya sp. NBC_00888]|uniref:GNAT family N-acetyltransferase n=1 Tax=Embleya sp. NBC_00888 TaxID=2975960 RepID=UPI002F90D623|nr:GNAT family N-acetyltransferase [Embleya sp. NBC_00888]